MHIFEEQVNKKLVEIEENLDKIESIEANFYTLGFFGGDNYKSTDYVTKMKEKKYGILFDKIPVYANSSLRQGEVKINYAKN